MLAGGTFSAASFVGLVLNWGAVAVTLMYPGRLLPVVPGRSYGQADKEASSFDYKPARTPR